MRLGISNIAWDIVEDIEISSILSRLKIDAIDICPTKYFPEPSKASKKDIADIKDWWLKRGVEITGMQALLFGTEGLSIFGSKESQDAMLHYLASICRIGRYLGASRLVFGSPKSRDCTGFSKKEAKKIAISFFRRLGEIAQSYGVVICLEPTPSIYGGNFMTTNHETGELVSKIGHSSIRMQLDTASITLSGENLLNILEKYAPLIHHIHASEPNLVPLGDGEVDHNKIANILKKYFSDHLISVEMLATSNEAHSISIERSLNLAALYYGNPGGLLSI